MTNEPYDPRDIDPYDDNDDEYTAEDAARDRAIEARENAHEMGMDE